MDTAMHHHLWDTYPLRFWMLIVRNYQWVSLHNLTNITFWYLEQCCVQLLVEMRLWISLHCHMILCLWTNVWSTGDWIQGLGHISQVLYYQNRSSVLGFLMWLHSIPFSLSARVYFLSLIFSRDWFRKTSLWVLSTCKCSSPCLLLGDPKSEMVPGTIWRSNLKLGVLKPKSNSPKWS